MKLISLIHICRVNLAYSLQLMSVNLAYSLQLMSINLAYSLQLMSTSLMYLSFVSTNFHEILYLPHAKRL